MLHLYGSWEVWFSWHQLGLIQVKQVFSKCIYATSCINTVKAVNYHIKHVNMV